MGNVPDMAVLEELLDAGLFSGFFTQLPARLIDVAIYVFTALSLYTIAKRRGIDKAWLAWIPVVNVWVLGCISDQYQDAANGKHNRRRRTLVILNIVRLVLGLMVAVAALFALGEIFLIVLVGMTGTEDMMNVVMLKMSEGLPMFAFIALVSIPLAVVAITYLVFYFLSLHDVYKSCDPGNATLFTALSVFFNILPPAFLFLCRDKDNGMPVRRPVSEEPWEQ